MHQGRAAAAPPAPTCPDDTIIDAATGVTRLELAAYYASAAESLLPHLRERPVTFVQLPNGMDGPRVARMHPEQPPWPDIAVLAPGLDPGHPPLLEIRTAVGLQSAVRRGVVELQTWNATVRSFQKPDRIVFDLEPEEGVAWPMLRDAARRLHAVLSKLTLKSFVKTSGARGLHVVVPLMPSRPWPFVEQFAQAVLRHVVEQAPDHCAVGLSTPLAAVAPGTHASTGRVRVDILGQGARATTVCAWSARAQPGVGVSVPVAWEELDDLSGGAHWTLRNAAERLAVGNRPWEQYAASRQGLASAIKTLGFGMAADSGRPLTETA